MEMLIGVAVYTLLLRRLWMAAREDYDSAKQGKASPRMEARHGAAAARAKVEQYGFLDYLRDAYHDFWGRRGDALAAARTAEPAAGRAKVRLRDRFAAAAAVISGTGRKIRDSSVGRALLDPAEPAKPGPRSAGKTKTADSSDLPEGTRRYTDTGQEEVRDGRWQPLRDRDDSKPAPSTPNPGDTVTASTGEATNFASAVAKIDALLAQVKSQYDQASAVMRALILVDNAIDGLEVRQRQIAAGARSLADELTALNLNPGILAPLFDAADVLTAAVAAEMMEYLERMKATTQRVLTACDSATAALQQQRSDIVGRFGDAAQTVAENLGGDSRFLSDRDTADTGQPSLTRQQIRAYGHNPDDAIPAARNSI